MRTSTRSRYAAGNFIGKSWVIQGGGRMTGLVVGAKAPIVLTSRGSGADEKFYSIVFAAAAYKVRFLLDVRTI